MRNAFIRLFIVLSFLAITVPLFPTDGVANTTVTLEKTTHFLTTDGSAVLVQPGTYAVEAAEEWLRLIPGERRNALLLKAHQTQHEEVLDAPKAVIQEEGDEYGLVLLLPGGKGLEAIGSASVVRSRAVKRPLTSRSRTQQQALRIPRQSKKNTVMNKSKPLTKSPAQPIDPLAQRVQTLEQQVRTLEATISTFQNRLSKIEAAVQVDNAGNITITLPGKFKVNASIVDISASSIKANAGLSKFSGTVQSDTLITNTVVSKSYTPGAGNIW